MNKNNQHLRDRLRDIECEIWKLKHPGPGRLPRWREHPADQRAQISPMRRLDWRYAPVVLLGGLVAADGDPAQCRDCYHEGYKIELSLIPLLSAPAAAVLFSGYRNGRCEDDFICTATPDIAWLGDLGTSSYNWWNSCDEREMVVFAGGHAPTPLQPSQADPTPLQPTLLRSGAVGADRLGHRDGSDPGSTRG